MKRRLDYSVQVRLTYEHDEPSRLRFDAPDDPLRIGAHILKSFPYADPCCRQNTQRISRGLPSSRVARLY